MQKNLGLLIPILLSLILGGCGPQAAQPDLDLSGSTPDQPVMEAQITPTTIPSLDPATEQALRLYPLYVGNTWVYEYLGYDQDQEVVWQVVESVIENRLVDGYFIAVLERRVELLDGEPPPDFLTTPDSGTFWYLVDGQYLYRFEVELFTHLSNAWLDLILPFPENNRVWFPDRSRREQLKLQRTGFRFASAPFKKVLPMGGTYTCYNIVTHLLDGSAEGTFCESMGFVYQEYDSEYQYFGYRSELRDFYIQ